MQPLPARDNRAMDRNPETPAFVAPQAFTDPDAAVAQVRRLYDAAVGFLREALADYVRTPWRRIPR